MFVISFRAWENKLLKVNVSNPPAVCTMEIRPKVHSPFASFCGLKIDEALQFSI